MTRDEAIGALTEMLAVPATATVSDLPTEVRLGPEDGIPRECVINLDHVDTMAKGLHL
jgi:mRNA interferase MazF